MSNIKTISIKIKTPFLLPTQHLIENFIQENVPSEVLEGEIDKFFHEALPIIHWDFSDKEKNRIGLTIISNFRKDVSQFFYQLISRWGKNHKSIHIDGFITCDFIIESIHERKTYSQMNLSVNEDDFDFIERNKKKIETEISLGASSCFHAQKLGEYKGLSQDAKTQMIQEKITSLITSRKKSADPQIFSRMQKFLVNSDESFKKKRDSSHLTRIITIIHLLRELLEKKISSKPKERHPIVKFIKTNLLEEGKKRSVLGVIVGLNFLKDHEIFEETHLYKAICTLISETKIVKNSCFIDRCKEKKFQVLYLELEKEGLLDFTVDEVNHLKANLPDKIKGSIESLAQAIFMPRNEEEVFRNIVTLSEQVKYVHDIPQVIINFQYKQQPLAFTVVMVRVLKENTPTLEELVKKDKSHITVERIRKIGVVRKKHVKEAAVMRVVLPSFRFLRLDNSIDLYRARNEVIKQLNGCFGEVRDYNGGLIDRQNRLLEAFKELCPQMRVQHEILMEKLFFSIRPQEMRTMLEPYQLKNLFYLVMNLNQSVSSPCQLLLKEEDKILYAVMKEDQKKILDYIVKNGFVFRLICFNLIEKKGAICGFLLKGVDSIRLKEFAQCLKEYFEKK